MLEKDIQKSCTHVLDFWKTKDVVIHYDIMSDAGRKQIRGRWVMHTKKGRPDINVYFNHKGICGILFIEVKTTIGKQSPDQIAFMMKFKDLSNVHYIIARAPGDVSEKLESITHHMQNEIENLTLGM